MLAKAKKLNSKEHKKVQNKGKRKNTPYFSLLLLEKQEGQTKCAVVIPKKTIKKAVKRNFYKRRIFSFVEDIYPQLLPGTHLVILLRKTPEPPLFDSLKEELVQNLPLI